MKIFIIIVLTVTMVQLPSIECEHPQYSFRCLENGEIHLFGLHKSSTIKSLQGDVGSCNETSVISPTNILNYYYVIPEECADSNTEQEDRSVQIVVQDPTIDKKERATSATKPKSTTSATIPPSAASSIKPTSTASRRRRNGTPVNITQTTPVITTTQFIGGVGKHSFNITCKSIPATGVNMTVVHVFQGKEYNILPVNNMEVDGVEMRFKAVNDEQSPDINTIYVGDEFFMFLEYKGTRAYYVIPKKCTAYSGTVLGNKGTKQVDLWNQDNHDCIQQKELLQGFVKKSPKLIYAEMFGFRFSDSNYITIQCEVGILPKYISETLCTKSTNSRKRRGIEDVEIKTKFAASKVRVYDNKDMYQMENKSKKTSVDISVWIVIVFGTLLNIW